MAMKRRGFLQMLGAALAAPALPSAASGLTPKIRALAAAHARKYPFVSVIGISKRVGVTVPEAEGLLIDLSRKGLVGPVNSCAHGPISASSRVFKPVVPLTRTFKANRAADRTKAPFPERDIARTMSVDLSLWLRHLHRICRAQGMPSSQATAGGYA